ncbi:MAG: hypothetical protein PHT59_06895 [Candidatus Omnitrophica bacterium]|nr:hypothetical protein [Candidatus Omnitrophota bacterium]
MRAKLFNHLLKLLWAFLLAYLILDFWLLSWDPGLPRSTFIPLIILSGLALAGWVYITLRVVLFKTRLVKLLNLVYEGNYAAGVQNHCLLTDELASLCELINKTIGRLKEYDRLRCEKVDFQGRALEMIGRMTEEGIMIADIEARSFQLNPVVQEMFDMKLERLDFDAVDKRPENAAFFEVFWDAAKRERVPKEKDVTLQLPIRDKTREVTVTVLPLKDRTENVKLAIIFVRSKLP